MYARAGPPAWLLKPLWSGPVQPVLQVITATAPKVEHLTVFQRSPQYSVPVGNGVVPPHEVAAIKQSYDELWTNVRNSMVAFGFEESKVTHSGVFR